MSWEEELFAYLDDLEGQAGALYAAERGPELADRSRAEYQSVTMATRLMAAVDHEVALELVGVGTVSGRLARVATGWCLVSGAGQDWVIRLGAIAVVQGGSDRAVPELRGPQSPGSASAPPCDASPTRPSRARCTSPTAAATTAPS